MISKKEIEALGFMMDVAEEWRRGHIKYSPCGLEENTKLAKQAISELKYSYREDNE